MKAEPPTTHRCPSCSHLCSYKTNSLENWFQTPTPSSSVTLEISLINDVLTGLLAQVSPTSTPILACLYPNSLPPKSNLKCPSLTVLTSNCHDQNLPLRSSSAEHFILVFSDIRPSAWICIGTHSSAFLHRLKLTLCCNNLPSKRQWKRGLVCARVLKVWSP